MKKIYALMIVLFLMNGAMAQWFPQNSGTTNNLNSVYFTDVYTGYAVGDSGTILKTMDGGINWIPQNAGTNKKLYSVYFPETNTGFAVGDSGTILKTTNGGAVWQVQTSNTYFHIYSVHFPCADTGYAVGGWCESALLKTTNGGANWTVIPFEFGLSFYSAVFVDANTGFLAGSMGCMQSDAVILKTTNGGLDWMTQNLGSWGSFYSVCFLDEYVGYVAGYAGDAGTADGILFKTSDGGVNWILQSSYTGYLYKSVQFLNADTGFITTNGYYSEGAILKTTNAGLNLTGQVSPTFSYSYPLNSIYFTDVETGYVVGNGGTILKTTDGGGFPVGINNQHQAENTLTIYPNPTSTSLSIETPTKGIISIHNISGQQLLQRTITEPTTTIDVSGWKSGVYLVKVVGEMGVHVGKIVKW